MSALDDTNTHTAASLTIGVLICTYRRPFDLLRGLTALVVQERRPDDVIVVVRSEDKATNKALTALPASVASLPLRVVTVHQPGVVHARNAGLLACRTDILAITDDDTVPHTDWLARILANFAAYPEVGGVGGRDWCFDGRAFDQRNARVVGDISWFGRMVGNHHLGYGAARRVQFLKGANMSFRARAFKGVHFDVRLRGNGVQAYEDAAFPIAVRLAGWVLLYDPAVAVDHYPGQRTQPRHYVGVNKIADAEGYYDMGHNEVIAIWKSLSPFGRVSFMVWSLLIGTGVSPGLLQALRFMPRLRMVSWHRFLATQAGKAAAYRAMMFGCHRSFPPAFSYARASAERVRAIGEVHAAVEQQHPTGERLLIDQS